MYISELAPVAELLTDRAAGSIVNTVYHSFGGTLIKLYGADARIEGLFFSSKERVAFPVFDLRPFRRDPLTNLEESLRKYLDGRRLLRASVDAARGRVLIISFSGVVLTIPLFAGKAVHLTGPDGAMLWSEHRDHDIPPLAEPLRDLPPRVASPGEWQDRFLARKHEAEEEARRRAIEKKKREIGEKIAKMRAERERALERSASFRATATAIKGALHTLSPHARTAKITLGDRDIPLDPEKSVLENMNGLFGEAKRLLRGTITLDGRIGEAERALATLDGNAPTTATVPERKKREPKAKPGARVPYHRYLAPSGRALLVGRSAADNDELTFKIASPHDLWFHAKDHAGSHVILRKGKGGTATEEEVFLGCCLALFYSKVRETMEGEVWFTERKFVKKTKGLAPGKVLITQGKPKYLRADRSFFEKLRRDGDPLTQGDG